jgi:nicotinate-nucleotide adenylyltransferase
MSQTQPITLLGGTFNPPHQGHIQAALATLDELAFPRLGLMPCKLPPHKDPVNIAPVHRLAMLQLACKTDPRLYVEDLELTLPSPSYTVNTLRHLRQQYPSSPICFLLGEDSLYNLPNWYEWQKLLDYAHVVVMPRPNHSVTITDTIVQWRNDHQVTTPNKLVEQPHGKVYLSQSGQYPVSSTQVRDELKKNKEQQNELFLRHWLNDDVVDYIKKNNLYS